MSTPSDPCATAAFGPSAAELAERMAEGNAALAERAIAERLIEAIRRDAREDVTWQRQHKQNHEDLVRIVATEDAYNAAIRTIETEVGL